MYLSSLSTIAISMLIIIQTNMSSVKSELAEIYKNDSRDWRAHGEKPNIAKFNSLYTISINEAAISRYSHCSGKCDTLDDYGKRSARNFIDSNQCPGDLTYCWFQSETAERRAAYEEWIQKAYEYYRGASREPWSAVEMARIKYELTGNLCKCLCHRTYNPNPIGKRGGLVDSICYDPVSVDEGYVATGVRLMRHDNIIYLHLKQAKLINGRIVEGKKKWTEFKRCSKANTRPAVYKFRKDHYKHLNIILMDIILPEDAVVTGVTFGVSVRGRYLTKDGNLDRNREEFSITNEYCGRRSKLVFNDLNLQPSTGAQESNVFSKSCENHVSFFGTSKNSDRLSYIVPYIDLQEIVTDPPEAIRGIGWYHRGFPGYGGFLALKIFIKE